MGVCIFYIDIKLQNASIYDIELKPPYTMEHKFNSVINVLSMNFDYSLHLIFNYTIIKIIPSL